MEISDLFDAINQEELEPNSDLAVIREVLVCVAHRRNFDTRTMKKFGELTGKAHQHRRLKPNSTKVEFELVGLSGGVRRIAELSLLVEELLVNFELDRVKVCAGDDCHHVFMDLSKNKSRKWCDMAHCGTLAKSKTFYDRHLRVNPLADSPTESKRGASKR